MGQIKEELTMENVQEFVEAARKALLVDYVDPSFLAGLCQVLDYGNKKVQGFSTQSIDENGFSTQSIDENVPPVGENETVDLIEEFYSKLSPLLGELMHNSSRMANYDFQYGTYAGNHENITIDRNI